MHLNLVMLAEANREKAFNNSSRSPVTQAEDPRKGFSLLFVGTAVMHKKNNGHIGSTFIVSNYNGFVGKVYVNGSNYVTVTAARIVAVHLWLHSCYCNAIVLVTKIIFQVLFLRNKLLEFS